MRTAKETRRRKRRAHELVEAICRVRYCDARQRSSKLRMSAVHSSRRSLPA